MLRESRWAGGGGCSTFTRGALSHLWGDEQRGWKVNGRRELRLAQSVSIEHRNCSDGTCLLSVSPWSKALQFRQSPFLFTIFPYTFSVVAVRSWVFVCRGVSVCIRSPSLGVGSKAAEQREIIFVGKSLRNEIKSPSDVSALSTRRIRYRNDAKRKDGNAELPRNVDYVNGNDFPFRLESTPGLCNLFRFFCLFAGAGWLGAGSESLAEIISARRFSVKRVGAVVAKLWEWSEVWR